MELTRFLAVEGCYSMSAVIFMVKSRSMGSIEPMLIIRSKMNSLDDFTWSVIWYYGSGSG